MYRMGAGMTSGPLSSALPPTPPPPPPPLPPPPTPYPGQVPGWAPYWPQPGYVPVTPIGPDETRAVRSVRSGVSLFRWVAVLGLAVQLVSIVELILYPSLAKLSSLSSTGGFSFSGSSGLSGASIAFSALAGGLGLVTLILGIIAFVRWREGISELRKGSLPSGPYPPIPLTGAAAKADLGYRRAVWTLLAWILALVGGGVALAFVFLASYHIVVNTNGTVVPPNAAQLNSAISSVIGAAVALAVVLLLLELALAYFTTGSLEGFVETGTPRARTIDLQTPRLLVLLSVAVGATGVLNVLYVGAGAVAIVGPVLLFLGCQQYLRAFDERLAAPTAGSVAR